MVEAAARCSGRQTVVTSALDRLLCRSLGDLLQKHCDVMLSADHITIIYLSAYIPSTYNDR